LVRRVQREKLVRQILRAKKAYRVNLVRPDPLDPSRQRRALATTLALEGNRR
jgi:hypothetical protein